MLKVVFDTNVFISAFAVPGSRSEEALLMAARGKIQLFTSTAILAETAGKLRGKFEVSEDDIIAVLKQASRAARIVKPAKTLSVLADDPDNRILECAATAGVDLIVTGDKHLLGLKTYESIGICRVADLLRMCAPGR